ncbi:5-methylcytosine restriction system specificity protein McrC [Shouchella lehensis]|uniref:Restriction endonuclease n=1 Tax=Shouchella lehensis TaxID=300825 RepID=A0A4Y7WKT0_9BACI|nr:hypothetical protein [Shouchella lehensis]MBG9783454.1 hypothetical protein [Shouchella lehensis]TES49153.1 hypothetical protein E2L03_06625 [Shouchella lehensis]
MKIINIYENSSYTLDSKYIYEFVQLLKDNKKLPVRLKEETLFFDSYTIGSIQIKDLIINILPRTPKVTNNHYLEMQLYNEGLLDEKIVSLLGESASYGIQDNLINLFLEETFELVSRGLEGSFIKIQEETNQIHGRILVDKISPINLLQDKIPIEYEMHTLNTSYNKLIKLALERSKILTKKKNHIKLLALTNSFFDEIDADIHNLNELLQTEDEKLYFSNEKYPIVLGLAKKILKDLKINLTNNKITSSSYLVNSNNLFEKYVRTVLTNHLKLKITKWDKPKRMGKLKVDSTEFIKSYSPDIMIDFHNDSNSAFAVLDAKNKDISNHNKIGSISDLYQLLFYCYSLNSNYGGLVYPYYGKLDPVRINIESFKETNLFAFSIDFSKHIKDRNLTFSRSIKETLNILN